ncbi:hypothetical protein AXF42_Ash014001 [Apostasia shenzhenica]|uniref:Uncharacterized protein n=1 Tax=Apostasia shenzhenica TaxID=1088818 RepID=A0A2I0A949_9ASPA|nr:hypothetical protein AXF42_Ash014001 [Apostasia shenzhenica]
MLPRTLRLPSDSPLCERLELTTLLSPGPQPLTVASRGVRLRPVGITSPSPCLFPPLCLLGWLRCRNQLPQLAASTPRANRVDSAFFQRSNRIPIFARFLGWPTRPLRPLTARFPRPVSHAADNGVRGFGRAPPVVRHVAFPASRAPAPAPLSSPGGPPARLSRWWAGNPLLTTRGTYRCRWAPPLPLVALLCLSRSCCWARWVFGLLRGPSFPKAQTAVGLACSVKGVVCHIKK